jgi:hypothetical protein
MLRAASITLRSSLVFDKAGPLREVLPEKAIGILVGSTVPRSMRATEVNRQTGFDSRWCSCSSAPTVKHRIEHQTGLSIKKLGGWRPRR